MGSSTKGKGESMIEYEFEVLCVEGSFYPPLWVARTSSKNRDEALAEAKHYVTQYSEEGPCEIWEVTRRKVWPE